MVTLWKLQLTWKINHPNWERFPRKSGLLSCCLSGTRIDETPLETNRQDSQRTASICRTEDHSRVIVIYFCNKGMGVDFVFISTVF